MTFDLKTLQTFRLVARFGSLSRAARQLGLTTPAVSIQIRNLEADLGAKLFDHRPNRVSLTHQGRILLREANGILDSVVKARESVNSTQYRYEGNLPISISADLSRLLLKRVSDFAREHPNLGLTILARRTRESIALLLGGEIELAIGFFPKVPRDVSRHTIMNTSVSLVVPRNHPMTQCKKIKLADIFEHRIVTRLLTLDEALTPKSSTMRLPNLIAVDTCQSVLDFVELGQGIGLVHDVCATVDPRKRLVEIDVTELFSTTSISLLTRSNSSLSPAGQALVRHLLPE